MKNINNGSKSYQVQRVLQDVRDCEIQSTRHAVAILYGDKFNSIVKIKANIEEDKLKQKFRLFSVNAGARFVNATGINFQERSLEFDANKREELIASLAGMDAVAIYKEDITEVVDYGMLIPNQLRGSRKISNCNDCDTYYSRICKCISASKIKGYGTTTNVDFYDIDGDAVSISKYQQNYKPFIGVEWELSSTSTRGRQKDAVAFFKGLKNTDALKPLLNLFADTKEDSSVSNGFELVTNPFSSSYYFAHQQSFEVMAQLAREIGLRGTGNGIHIHVSKESFDSSHALASWFKLFYNNSNILEKLAGRSANDFCRLRIPAGYDTEEKANNYEIKTYASDSVLKRLAEDAIDSYISSAQKYQFLNLSRSKTIEYRLPASTTDSADDAFSNFCRHIELILASVEYANQIGITDVSFASFIDWLSESEFYANIHDAIVSNEEVLKLAYGNNINASKALLAKGFSLDEIDATNAESIELARASFESMLEAIKPVEAEEVEKNVKKVLNKTKKIKGGK